MITNRDLIKNRYSYTIDELEKNIDQFCLKTLLYTQKLTAAFCNKYIIMNEEHASCFEETWLDKYDVIDAQPHLSLDNLD